MKVVLFIIGLLVTVSVSAQRDLTPTRKRDAFGTRDLRSLSNTGLQFQFGATYLMTRPNGKNIETTYDNGVTDGTYVIDPSGRLGGFAEIGLTHFPKKRSKLSLALKTVLVSYYDWGLGFKYFRGIESITVNRISPLGVVIGSQESSGEYSSGWLYGRFSLHKNVHIKPLKNIFLDNSLGVNIDYNLLPSDPAGSPYSGTLISVGAPTHYHTPLVAQLHYGLGIGIRLKRGAYLIPGARLPILGINEWHKGNPSFKWFSRSYWPILFHVKYMFLFEKKAKGCPAVEINDQDKNTQRNR